MSVSGNRARREVTVNCGVVRTVAVTSWAYLSPRLQ